MSNDLVQAAVANAISDAQIQMKHKNNDACLSIILQTNLFPTGISKIIRSFLTNNRWLACEALGMTRENKLVVQFHLEDMKSNIWIPIPSKFCRGFHLFAFRDWSENIPRILPKEAVITKINSPIMLPHQRHPDDEGNVWIIAPLL